MTWFVSHLSSAPTAAPRAWLLDRLSFWSNINWDADSLYQDTKIQQPKSFISRLGSTWLSSSLCSLHCWASYGYDWLSTVDEPLKRLVINNNDNNRKLLFLLFLFPVGKNDVRWRFIPSSWKQRLNWISSRRELTKFQRGSWTRATVNIDSLTDNDLAIAFGFPADSHSHSGAGQPVHCDYVWYYVGLSLRVEGWKFRMNDRNENPICKLLQRQAIVFGMSALARGKKTLPSSSSDESVIPDWNLY